MRPINEERLRSTLEFIRQYQISEGRTPTYREIKEGCGYSSLGSVSADINRLKERGLIEDDNTTGWNRIKIPNNLQSQGTHNTLIVGAVPCGQPTPAIEDIEAAVALPDAIFGCADHVILRAKGPSMIKRGIFDEDLLVVSRQETAEYGETVIALLEDGDSTCKILAKKSNGKPYLKAANDETDKNGRRIYDVYPKGDWRIYGVVDYVIHAPVREEF